TRPPGVARWGNRPVIAGREGLTGSRRLVAVVQLDVPIEIVAPAFRGVPQADRNPQRRRLVRPPRRAHQPHACLLGRASALAAIARDAAGEHVSPLPGAAM